MWEFLPPRFRLLGTPQLPGAVASRLQRDYEKFREGLPRPLEAYVRDVYELNLTSEYGGWRVKNPFGKASGQLSLATHQVERDAEAGLGFVVLKTVIAQDRAGEQTMGEWAIPETRMVVERIRGRSGAEGWTVTWKGRGWFDTFQAYLDFFDQSLRVGSPHGLVIAPSVKYHLPTPDEDYWKEEEYHFTTAALVEVWARHHPDRLMPIEKDFSPTLAGSERAVQQAKILEWLNRVPGLIHNAAPGKVAVGLKIFNTLFEDQFQICMLDTAEAAPAGADRADFLVYANRLFDPHKTFEDKTGVAYGGPDLSDRNLAALERWLSTRSASPALPVSATGDIHSGRLAAEYLLRGASSFQMHTLFQLPDSEFSMPVGSKTEKALHRLLFHPEEGFIAWVLTLRQRFGWKPEATLSQLADWCRNQWATVSREFAS
jgi:dihydroorotate dehydrogenase